MDLIFFVHQPIDVIVEWNEKELQKVNTKLGEITKVFKGLRIPKKGDQKQFFKKAPGNHREAYSEPFLKI